MHELFCELTLTEVQQERYLDEDGEDENFGRHFDVGAVVGVRWHVRPDDSAVLVVGEVGAGLVARGS